jgi:hypothetical protein
VRRFCIDCGLEEYFGHVKHLEFLYIPQAFDHVSFEGLNFVNFGKSDFYQVPGNWMAI